MASVRFESVSKQFDDGTVAVRELDLEIADGEFVVFVGPSGCGKTTALRMVAGLEEISSGTIRIGEEAVNDLAPNERDISMVFQSYALFPHLDVAQNIGFGLKVRRHGKAEVARKVEEVADILDLSELLKRKPRQLSGGQRQRVAMGRAIVREPRALLMDEPLSNLDAKLRGQMRAEITRVQREVGTTTIYVTHDQVEAMTMGHRIAVMRGGVLQQVGPPTEVYSRPVNTFVAGFLGSPSMNVVAAVADGDGVRLPGGARIGHPPGIGPVADGPVQLGVRPEGLRLAGDGEALLRGMVLDVEVLGRETLVGIELDGAEAGAPGTTLAAPFLALLPAAVGSGGIEIGDRLGLAFDLADVHLFDAESGRTLRAGAATGNAAAPAVA